MLSPSHLHKSIYTPDTGDAFVHSLRTDLEKLLVAKGFKVTGPYDSLDVMTFPEKQGATLTLTPIIDIRADNQVTQNTPATGMLIPGRQEGLFVVGGWVALVMLEPMSGEKMWVKRVEVEPVQELYSLTYTVVVRNNQRIQNIHSDTRPQALTTALNRIYPDVLQKAWTYFHPEEVMNVKRQADEVRKLKRY